MRWIKVAGYLILANFPAYLILRGFISAISEKTGLKGIKFYENIVNFIFAFFVTSQKPRKLILVKISENKVFFNLYQLTPDSFSTDTKKCL